MKPTTLSVVLATFNEEKNLPSCLESVKNIADEIVIVDGSSTDKTVSVAKKFGAKVVVTDNPPIFHINKQKALDLATSEWILQLDADEQVSPELGQEIKKLLAMTNEEITVGQKQLPDRKLFLRHQRLLQERDGTKEQTGQYNAFFVPRLNYFLGRYLRYGGVYPDGVIRLVRKGKAHFPCKDVHEQIAVAGKVGWLQNPLYHYDSPTFHRYTQRNNRYIKLLADELQKEHSGKDLFTIIKYMLVLPTSWFVSVYGRHKGFKDGWQGFVFAFFSALRFPRAYIKYLTYEHSN
jgi:glycosyltransferase involved in cell wall biosynthesis